MKTANLSFIKSLNLDLNVKDKLSRLLTRTIEGNEDVYMTPIAKEHTPELLFSELNKVFNTGKFKLNSTLIDMELANKEAFGSRSYAVPWKVRKSILADSFTISKSEGIRGIKPLLGRAVLRPLSRQSASLLLKNDTSSGLPFFTKKGVVKERVLNKFDDLLNRKDPCILFTRTQEQKKTRNVWGYPMVDTLNEMMYYSPLLKYQRELAYRSALISPI